MPHGEEERTVAKGELVRAVLAAIAPEIVKGPRGAELRARAEALGDAVFDADRTFRAERVYRDDEVRRVNEAALRVTELAPGFTMSDVDRPAQAVSSFFFDATNMLARLGGQADHEGTWDGERWVTWNREVECFPKAYHQPDPRLDTVEPDKVYFNVREVVRRAGLLRVVAGGHTFNESTSTGGERLRPAGTLLSLDRFTAWRRVVPDDAARSFGVRGEAAERVVRVQAGKRLRDLTEELWEAGLALSVAGSTDAQSLGGLLATDLHGTGRDHGFLSEAVLEARVVKANGELVTFTRAERGWTTDERPQRTFDWLPVAGALGMLGVVVELVLQVDRAYHLEKAVRFVPRDEVERDLAILLRENDHLSFYYPGGVPGAKTVRMNTWNRTERRPSPGASFRRLAGELSDHALVSFAPGLLFDIGLRDARSDDLVRYLNRAESVVLPAPAAFARRLFFAHDEIEYGLPVEGCLGAIRAVMDLLAAEELRSIVEVRFTPDRSAAVLGPGTAGRGRGGTAYIELATPLGMYSDARIAQVYEKFDRLLRPFGARPHLGKKTAMTGRDMAAIHGEDWARFQALRREWDPEGKLLPGDNLFLQKIFGERG